MGTYLKPTSNMEDFFSTLKKWKIEDWGISPQVDPNKEYIIEEECNSNSKYTLLEDLISYSESTGERFPLEKRLEDEGAQMRPMIKDRIQIDIEVAYQISQGNFDEIANNTLRNMTSPVINPGLIDFILDNFPEEFNKALRAAPKENWEKHVYSCKYGCGKGSGYYDPYLDFRYVKPPEILELEDPRELRKCKWPENFDPSTILIRFTKSIKMMKWS